MPDLPLSRRHRRLRPKAAKSCHSHRLRACSSSPSPSSSGRYAATNLPVRFFLPCHSYDLSFAYNHAWFNFTNVATNIHSAENAPPPQKKIVEPTGTCLNHTTEHVAGSTGTQRARTTRMLQACSDVAGNMLCNRWTRHYYCTAV